MVEHLSEAKVKAHRCAEHKRQEELVDASRTGLYLLTTKNGSKSYMWRFRSPVTKTTAHVKISKIMDMSLNEARERVVELRRLVANGIDPRDEKKEPETTPKLTQFIEEQYLPYKKYKRSVKKDHQMYRDRLKKRFGDQRLDQIKRKDIQLFHTDLRNEGLAPATCDHYVKLLRHVLYLAVDWELIPRNVAARIPLYNIENSVDNVMNSEELSRFLKILNTDHNRPVCEILLYTLATAARIGSVLSCRWQDCDLEARIWRLNRETAKGKKTLYIPINDVALDILKRNQNDNEYVFLNRHTGTKICTIASVFHRLREAAGLPKLRIHDLRHQAASIMVQQGQSLYTVSKVLTHMDQRVSARYSHLDTAALQNASKCVSDKITEAMKVASAE